MGFRSLAGQTTGGNNIAIGWSSSATQNGSENVCIGNETMKNSTGTPGSNTVIGQQAGENLTGSSNVFIGCNAGQSITSGLYNMAIGTFLGHAEHSSWWKNASSFQFALGNVEYGSTEPPLFTGTMPNVELSLNAAEVTLGNATGGKIAFLGGTPTARISESLATGALGTPIEGKFGFATKAEAEAAFKFIEKLSKWAHETGITA